MNKIALITGSSSGIGKETAIGLAKQNFDLILHGRDIEKLDNLSDFIKKNYPSTKIFASAADFGTFEGIRNFADFIKQKFSKIDVLINNAGTVSPVFQLTEDGFERTFAVNHLSYFYLTGLLIDQLLNSSEGRIINISSQLHFQGKIHFDDLNLTNNFDSIRAYNQSKLANVLFTYHLSRKLSKTKITVNAVHPGAVNTGLDRDLKGTYKFLWSLSKPFQLKPAQGAETSIFMACSHKVKGVTGKYYVKKEEKPSSDFSYNQEAAARLWELSEQMCGVNY
ncbi:MAG: SDR family oxidoreductase [Candidatus Kapabacteria bacterium]|nr:SDR family oxidoreductase [Candidatus Kapabacteria bacterium]